MTSLIPTKFFPSEKLVNKLNFFTKKPVINVSMCVHRSMRVEVHRQLKQLEECPFFKVLTRTVSGDALIARSRNRAATFFMLNDKDSEIMLFLDDDIVFKPLQIGVMLQTMISKD